MRNLKKVLALVIAFSMMLSAVAFAGYQDVAADADYAGAVELLSALGVFEGDENGNFNPDKTVTRAEMAAIICRATGVDAAAQTATDYSDVPASHWASGYIAHASDAGILNGVGGGLFNPAGTLTYQQALKIVVYALGFELMAEDNGGWSAGSIYVANRYKITEGADSTATRGNLAVILANAMKTPMMDKTSYGEDAKFEILNGKNDKEYRTLLTDMDIYIATGVVGEKDVDEIAFEIKEDSDDGEFTTKKSSQIFKIGDSNIAEYQNQNVDAYVQKVGKKYEVVAVVATALGETFELLSDDIEKVTVDGTTGDTTVEYFVDAANSSKTKEIEVKKGHTVEYNKGAASKTLGDFKGVKDVELVFIENDGDDVYDYVVATSYLSDRVDYVDAANDKLTLKNIGRTINFDFEDEEATIILVDEAGAELTLADFAKDDVVAVVADNATNPARYTKYIKVVKLSNAAVTGSVDSTYKSNGEDYVVIDGNDYIDTTGELNAGDEGTFYIGITGKIIAYDATLAGANYAYILEGAIAQGSFTSDQWQLKLLTESDGIVTYDVKKEYHDEVAKYITDNFKLNEKKDAFLWDVATDKNAAYRIVEYDVNSKGEIKELKAATTKEALVEFKIGESEYREGTQKLGTASLEDDVVIFNVSKTNVKDVATTDISFLVDESTYAGFSFKDEDGEYSAVVITDLESRFSADDGFAVVTKRSLGYDDGEEIVTISYIQNEEPGTITFGEDSVEALNNEAVLDVGDVFMFVADADGVVSEYLVIATYDEDKEALVLAEGDLEGKLKVGNEETTLVLGNIENDRRITKSKGEVITVGGKEYVVPTAAYKYTFNTKGRNNGIEVSDFMYEAEYCELGFKEVEYDLDEDSQKEKYDIPTDKATTTVVFLRIVDDEVVDVYSVNAAKTISAPAALIDAWKNANKDAAAKVYEALK